MYIAYIISVADFQVPNEITSFRGKYSGAVFFSSFLERIHAELKYS